MLSPQLHALAENIVHYPMPVTNDVIPANPNLWNPDARLVPVLVIKPGDAEAAIRPGTITLGRPSAPSWLVDSGDSTHFATVAALNPNGIEGRYYRVISEDGEGPLVRFESNRWVVISGPGNEPWEMGEGDFFSAYTMPLMFYVEVEAPGRVTDPTPLAGEMFNGHSAPDAILNPGIITGALYCVIDLADPETVLLAYREYDRWSTLGHWYGERDWYPGLPSSDFPDFTKAGVYWAEPKLGHIPYVVNLPDAEQEEQRLTLIAVDLEERERQINKDMNEVAKEQGWCEQYEERIIDPLGLMHRKDEADDDEEDDTLRNWTVSVEGTLRIEEDSPSAEFDEYMRSYTGWDFIESNSLVYNSAFSIKVGVEDCADEDDAKDAVTDGLICEELGLTVTRSSIRFTVTDWDAIDAE